MKALFIYMAMIISTHYLNAFADVHVDVTGSQSPDGTSANPYQLINAGVCKAQPNESVIINPGAYNETMSISKPIKLFSPGTVVIGQTAGKPHTKLKVLTQNTHLFGNEGGGTLPQFADSLRAEHFVKKVIEENADLVALQEVWDPDLANAIIQRAGFPFHFYNRDYDDVGDFLNSGLLLLSKHPLINPSLTYYENEAHLTDCAKASPSCLIDHPTEPWQCLKECEKYLDGFASRGFIQTTINKDGFQIGVFITHTQAEEHKDAVKARKKQLEQLGLRIKQYLLENPAAEVIAMGDINVIGESTEYYQTLLPNIALRDAIPNTPCADSKLKSTCTPSNPLASAKKFGACSTDQRLDYVFYSHNGRFDIIPIWADVKIYTVLPAIKDEDFSANNLSDHYGIAAEFALYR